MMKSYEFGKKFINKLSESNLMDKISLSAGILGLTVIGSMTASMVEVSTPLVLQFGSVEPISIQALLDSILPGLLPLSATWIVAGLLKKQVKVMNLMFGILLTGVVGTLIGVL
jgi:mannose/fructose/N-acetylgalactosamine-specific phosphotransferase system component IID